VNRHTWMGSQRNRPCYGVMWRRSRLCSLFQGLALLGTERHRSSEPQQHRTSAGTGRAAQAHHARLGRASVDYETSASAMI
jgi:hypothetical protein